MEVDESPARLPYDGLTHDRSVREISLSKPDGGEKLTEAEMPQDDSCSPWNDDSFLLALQSGFDTPSSSGSSPLPLRRRSLELSGLKQVLEEKSDCGSTPEPTKHGTAGSEKDGSEQVKGDIETGNNTLVAPHPPAPLDCQHSSSLERARMQKPWWKFDTNRNAFRFGVRISVVLTVSSLFVLAQPPDTQAYPQGVWVYISALMVSWFPSLAAASVVEKTFQRILGTCMGACLGVGVGFISITMPDFTSQAIFLGASIMIVSFLYAFATIQFKRSIFAKYEYASLLCLVTFGIAVLPFYTHDHPKWKNGIFRVLNVIVGCVIGGAGALLLWPRSTKHMLREKIEKQVRLAGEASKAVLEFAAGAFRMSESGRAPHVSTAANLSMRRLSQASVQHDDGADCLNYAAHEKYNEALEEWKGIKAVFPLTKWDPLLRLCGDQDQDAKYRDEVALTLARALRIQTTVVILDGLVRNDRSSDFSTGQLETVGTIGSLIKVMLTPPYNAEQSDAAAQSLIDELDDVRGLTLRKTSEVLGAAATHRRLFSGSMGKEDLIARLGQRDNNMVLCMRSHDSVALLFFQLLEHLIVRSLRLYYIWRQVEK